MQDPVHFVNELVSSAAAAGGHQVDVGVQCASQESKPELESVAVKEALNQLQL